MSRAPVGWSSMMAAVFLVGAACASDPETSGPAAGGTQARTEQTAGASGALVLDAPSSELTFVTYDASPEAWSTIREQWVDGLLARYPEGTWAPMRFEPTDEQLRLLRLPPREFLAGKRFDRPTMVYPDGRMEVVELPAAELASPVDGILTSSSSVGPAFTTYGGTGCLGIRPGAWLLLLDDGIGWCSLAHAYGTPGSYKMSTAGHCGKVGDSATVIAAFGNRDGVLNPVLLTFGSFVKSTGDGGIGNDWALLSVASQYQSLVSPTMCAWGGPRGMYTKTGSIASASMPRRGVVPDIFLNPDPGLAQVILHYGHGTGVGVTGTPRVGAAQHWAVKHFSFFGAISPGDSGSGSNALSGDGVGTLNEAAGINTHLYVDPSLKTGVGFMAGTRATEVTAALANGQLVGWPAPLPVLP